MKIWQKHLLGKMTQTFFFFLTCLFVIYVVIDLSAHGVRFFSKSSLTDIIFFYLNTFATLLDLFLTLTFLLASMRVLFNLNAHREMLALQIAGISKKGLLAPFFLFASCLSLICYVNTQWILPNAQEFTNTFKIAHKSKKNKLQSPRLFTMALKDESELIYQRYCKEKKELFDVFWVRTSNDIWHMKTLQLDTLQGQYVNHFTRNTAKQLEKSESFVTRDFSDLSWDDEALFHRVIPYEGRPISTLFLQACTSYSEKRIVCSHLYYKLLGPLIPFLALVAVAPISMHYARNPPIFWMIACSIFGLVDLKVILDGMLILGENQVLPSYIALFSPILLILSFCVPPFARMR